MKNLIFITIFLVCLISLVYAYEIDYKSYIGERVKVQVLLSSYIGKVEDVIYFQNCTRWNQDDKCSHYITEGLMFLRLDNDKVKTIWCKYITKIELKNE